MAASNDDSNRARHRKFIVTTDSRHGFPIYPNLAGKLQLTDVNQLWIADITYIRLEIEFVYLAVVLDAFSRRVIGWALDRTLEAKLTVAALEMALSRRSVKTGLVHHSESVRERRNRRSPAHRLDEFPVGYSSASCTPAELASALPTGIHSATRTRCRQRSFQPTANSVLTLCVTSGDNPTGQSIVFSRYRLIREDYSADVATTVPLHSNNWAHT